jgi:hypothetical protein
MPLYKFLHKLLNVLIQIANIMGLHISSSCRNRHGSCMFMLAAMKLMVSHFVLGEGGRKKHFINVWGEVSMGGGTPPHIINCSLVVLHCTVPVTAVDTKLTALTARDSGYCPHCRVEAFLEMTSLEPATLSVWQPSPCAKLPHHPPAEIIDWGGRRRIWWWNT